MALADCFSLIAILFISFSFRLNTLFWPNESLLLLIFCAPIIAIPIFRNFGLYRIIIRFIGFKSLWGIIQAVSLYALIWGLLVFLTGVQGVPRSVILINWLLTIIIVCGSRVFISWILSEYLDYNSNITKVVIYGAGPAGRQLSNALSQSYEFKPIAFIDDDNELYKKNINGLEVISKEDLKEFIKKNNVKEVLLAIPSLSRNQKSHIINFLSSLPVNVRTLPSVSELTQGKVKVNDLLEIDIRDLLGRDSVKPNTALLKTNITSKIVLVTGAGGSIGSELCRQILLLKPKQLVLYDISEPSLYQIEQELIDINILNVEVSAIIGSISDMRRMKIICKRYSVQTIYHAAAYKHVPLVEQNPSQGILNNAIGTMIAAQAAISANVDTFVLISTDKAVRPTSVMGASKRVAELVLQAFAQEYNTCFTMVRFGNVLDSSGSVIPLFKKQIKSGGPITVTHANIVRYFMTIPEAVELVIQAGAMAKGGEVFVLDMGEPIRIYDLAVKMIKLSGLQVLDLNNPEGDIEIQYTGLRPGEKLYEELFVDGNFLSTENKLIMRAEEKMINWDKLEPLLTQIKEAAINAETEKIYKLLTQLVPQFNLTTNSTNDLKSIDKD
jgi:FlaA1/EpsC-like NDP-sugar epimerase